MTKSRTRRVTPREQWIDRVEAQEAWPVPEEPRIALGEPEIGLDQSEFYRWRRSRSDPPPPTYEPRVARAKR
jgi:hypothetical protein